MSRMRMIAETGTESRKVPIKVPSAECRTPSVAFHENTRCFENGVELLRRAVQRQIADIEVPCAEVEHRSNRSGADVDGRRATRKLLTQSVYRHRASSRNAFTADCW